MSTLPTRCPRCSSLRIEGVDTCPRCQWRYVAEPAAPSPWVAPNSAAPNPRQPGPESVSVQLQAPDRRMLARLSLAAFQVRCLGATGGCLGMLIGAFAGSVIAAGLTHNAAVTFLGLLVGVIAGMLAGMFVALRLMAR